jgi:hypothetical protein
MFFFVLGHHSFFKCESELRCILRRWIWYMTLVTLMCVITVVVGWYLAPIDNSFLRYLSASSVCRFFDDPPMTYINCLIYVIIFNNGVLFGVDSINYFNKSDQQVQQYAVFVFMIGNLFFAWSFSVSPFDAVNPNLQDDGYFNVRLHFGGYIFFLLGLIALDPVLWHQFVFISKWKLPWMKYPISFIWALKYLPQLVTAGLLFPGFVGDKSYFLDRYIELEGKTPDSSYVTVTLTESLFFSHCVVLLVVHNQIYFPRVKN